MKRGPLSGDYRAALDVLVAVRRSNGQTQRDVAAALGRPPSYIAKIELGERKLDFLELIELAEALGRRPSDLITAMATAVNEFRK